jgi:hypothetical protein
LRLKIILEKIQVNILFVEYNSEEENGLLLLVKKLDGRAWIILGPDLNSFKTRSQHIET